MGVLHGHGDGCFARPMMVRWFFLLGALEFGAGVQGQPSTRGFISIDCGIPGGDSYTDPATNLTYVSDAGFVDAGDNHDVSPEYISDHDYLDAPLPHALSTLRSFPSGDRNCYTLSNLQPNLKHLVRATFYYGNYDFQNRASPATPLRFDLHLGADRWATISLTDPANGYSTEITTVPNSNRIFVCLINTGSGAPFISSLELRPLVNSIQPAATPNSSLVLQYRANMGTTTNWPVRYPDDPFDRIWKPKLVQTSIFTDSAVESRQGDVFRVPSAVLSTAEVAPADTDVIQFDQTAAGSQDNTRAQYYFVMHFAELQAVEAGELRAFDVFLNGELWDGRGDFTPEYLLAGHMFSLGDDVLHQYNFSIRGTDASTLPPIINALEIFTTMPVQEVVTDNGDVDAILTIKEKYGVKRNWMGDPCAPISYAWEGVTCDYDSSDPLRIITLNLSSSALTGEIDASIAELRAINILDLSENSLTGEIPSFLADMSSLTLLNLTGNQLSGYVPAGLLSRSKNGSLVLSISGNPNLCISGDSCERKKKKIMVPIIVTILIVLVLLLGALLCICKIIRKGDKSRQNNICTGEVLNTEGSSLHFEMKQFSYQQLTQMTKNFERIIGIGGFGKVFFGTLEDGTQVAVKLLSESQGQKEFVSEVQFLTRVHHKNLVNLVGYCKEKDSLALVFEHMAGGNLKDHLSGKAMNVPSLTWGERLKIALEVAEGLEYLHMACRPPIIHRDVKTSNILLTHKLEGKLADFGMSKAFPNDTNTHVSTAVVGTLGYLDPEYQTTGQLNEKSDVYSFGVVLLELITSQPAILSGNVHVLQWVKQRLGNGDIADIVDTKMKGVYDINSAWKVFELAMSCMAQASTERDSMSNVVLQLKEALELEARPSRVHVAKPLDSSLNLTTAYLGNTPEAEISAR